MLASATTKLVATDGRKFGRISFTRIADFTEVDVIVTDYVMDEEWRERMEDCGVQVVEC